MIGSLTWHTILQDYDVLAFLLYPLGEEQHCDTTLQHRQTGEIKHIQFTLPPEPADRLIVSAGHRLQEALGD